MTGAHPTGRAGPGMAPAPEVRLERMRPHEVADALGRAPVAWIPLGAIEYHADHLPIGTDGVTAHGVVTAAARRLGGVVLPWSYLTLGTLALPWSLRFDPLLVAEALRATLRQLPANGVRVAVVHTGHAPLDLIHLVKRVAGEVEAESKGLRVYGLCYLELNAALGTGLGTDWPVAVDHGSTMETSWVAALEPDLVALDRLPADPAASVLGIYGPNPRHTYDAERGRAQVDAAAELLAERVAGLVRGEPLDPYADLRGFVDRYWPEPLLLAGRAGDGRVPAALLITNPAPVSRYVSGVSLRLGGHAVPGDGLTLVNRTAGESGVPMPVATLGPERGFYIRRNQTAELTLPGSLPAGVHEVRLRLELAGVRERELGGQVEFT